MCCQGGWGLYCQGEWGLCAAKVDGVCTVKVDGICVLPRWIGSVLSRWMESVLPRWIGSVGFCLLEKSKGKFIFYKGILYILKTWNMLLHVRIKARLAEQL